MTRITGKIRRTLKVLNYVCFVAAMASIGYAFYVKSAPVVSELKFDKEWNFRDTEVLAEGSFNVVCQALDHGGSVFFVINGIANTSEGHPNFFQTAPLNGGIRFEMSPTADSASLVIASPTTPSGLEGFEIKLSPGSRFEAEFAILNGNTVRTRFSGLESERSGLTLKPLCSDFRVGGGYDASRNWVSSGTLRIVVTAQGIALVPTLFESEGSWRFFLFSALLFVSWIVISSKLKWIE